MPFIQEIADFGVDTAISSNPAIAKGVETHNGELVGLSLASSTGKEA
jgi:alanine dehydrogenase